MVTVMPLAIALIVAVVVVLGGALAYRARLGGTLWLTISGEQTVTVSLPPLPLAWRRTGPLLHAPGLLVARGCLIDRQAWVWLRLTDTPAASRYLAPGGDPATISGVDMAYSRGGLRPRERERG
jgi:hypothetical protein